MEIITNSRFKDRQFNDQQIKKTYKKYKILQTTTQKARD